MKLLKENGGLEVNKVCKVLRQKKIIRDRNVFMKYVSELNHKPSSNSAILQPLLVKVLLPSSGNK